MSELIQHVFECKGCNPARPCFMIYVESSVCKFSVIEKYISKIFLVKIKPQFKHKYSIPYVGDE